MWLLVPDTSTVVVLFVCSHDSAVKTSHALMHSLCFLIWFAPMVGPYAANYWPGMHTAAFSVVRKRKNLSRPQELAVACVGCLVAHLNDSRRLRTGRSNCITFYVRVMEMTGQSASERKEKKQ